MAFQPDNAAAWAQMQLQAAAQYQQIPGFMAPQQQPQMQQNVLAQAPPQVPQNVFGNLPLQQQNFFGQQPQIQHNQSFDQPRSSQPPPPFMAQQPPRQQTPQWTTPPPSQHQSFQRPPPPSQRPQLNQFRSTAHPQTTSWNNSVENSRSVSSDKSKSQVESPEESNLMDYDFGDMGAAAKNFSAESTKENQSNVVYDGTDGMEHDGDPPMHIPDSDSYRQRHGLTVWDSSKRYAADATEIAPAPYQRFEDFRGLSRNQLESFYKCGYTAPTPIQAQSWPIAMADRDMVSIAKTGSGKTLAFLLPAYKKMDARRGPNGVINVLILAPTRELATQIQEEAEKFGHAAGYSSTCAYGGAPRGGQLDAIRRGVSIVVATPGRLNDFIDSNQIDLSSVFYLVLDEADRMLDMGFEPQIRAIIKRVPRRRQTMMFSATWPKDVRQLANDFLIRPIHVQLGDFAGGGLQANADIIQHLILLQSEEDKDSELYEILKERFNRNRNDLALIFVARKNTCDFVTNMLNRKRIPAAAMHSDRDQKHRERTLAAFRDGSTPVLVATDVASRGLDVRGVGVVINYDLANTTEDYVHRIGRTGRAGDKGEAITFLTRSGEDTFKAMGIIDVMKKARQTPPPAVQQMVDAMLDRQQRNRERNAAEDEQFTKVLMVAEKPSVAKMIAEYLSGGRLRTRRGQSRALQIFEFIKYFGPARQKCKIMVTSVVGHVYGLTFEDGRVRDLADLFNAKVKKQVEDSTKKLKVVEHLQELAQEAEYLCLWLDCDLEGENIGFEVISLCQEWIPYVNVSRAKFSALTQQELTYAFNNLVKPDKHQAMCVDARQEMDLKIGVAFTRLMTRTYLDAAKEKFRLKDQTCISYGPCQTPTLSFCVKRHKEIQAFRQQSIFIVTPNINIDGYDVPFKWADGEHVVNQGELKRMESAIKSAVQNNGGTIFQVQENRKKINRPVGLNTVTLLKACSKGLGMSPIAAMKAAEHLYTSGYISYPRTETTAYSPTFDLIAALQEQAGHPNWGKVVNYLLSSGRVRTPEKGHDVGDHPPITPMKAATRDELSKGGEWKIYDYVTRHFIASLHDDMEYLEKKIIVDLNGYKFQYAWHEVIDGGFMFAMPWKRKALQLNEIDWPMPQYMLQEGGKVRVNGSDTQTDQTKPPDYLQESDLIALMDKHRIGTDASIPQHIKNICDRHYVDVCGPGEDGQKGAIIRVNRGGPHFSKMRGGRGGGRGGNQEGGDKPQSRHMVPRGFGLAFFSCFEDLDNELCDPSIRAWMESQVMKIATGETEKNEVVDKTIELFLDKFLKFRESLSRCDRFFGVKSDSGSSFGGGGSFGGDRGGYGADRGRDFGGDRGGGFGGRGFRGGGGRGGGQGFGRGGGQGAGRGGGQGGGRGGGQGGGMVGRDGGGRGGGRGGGGRGGGGPRFGGGRDNDRGGYGNNRDNGGTGVERGRASFDRGGFDNGDFSHGAKRPSGDSNEDYTKRFRGGENLQRQPQQPQRTPLQPPEGCSWW